MDDRAHDRVDTIEAERRFFTALVNADTATLGSLLADDFTLVDLTGGQANRLALIEMLSSGQLKFEAIEQLEQSPRLYGNAAIVTGRTQMRGQAAGVAFTFASRYTHVYVKQTPGWLLAAAQGTPMVA